MFLESSDDSSMKAFEFLFGEMSYGERVEDDFDQKCLSAMCEASY
jgi:hypothetical protein